MLVFLSENVFSMSRRIFRKPPLPSAGNRPMMRYSVTQKVFLKWRRKWRSRRRFSPARIRHNNRNSMQFGRFPSKLMWSRIAGALWAQKNGSNGVTEP